MPFPGAGPRSDACIATSAAVARYSRQVAAEMYGDHRPFGYVYGGSGGAYKTISCVENHLGVWDGALPYVHGTPKSIPVLLIASESRHAGASETGWHASSTRSSRAAAATCSRA